MTRIVLAYSACGKTHAARACPDRVLDMVAMPYKYHLPEAELSPEQAEAAKGTYADESTWNMDWPRNYVDAVEREADSGKWAYILCPSDWRVLEMLAWDGYAVHVVVPEEGLKEEYRRRFEERGSIALMEHFIDGGTWESQLANLEAIVEALAARGYDVTLSRLGTGQYLLHVM